MVHAAIFSVGANQVAARQPAIAHSGSPSLLSTTKLSRLSARTLLSQFGDELIEFIANWGRYHA
jgi:hypothetical protein